MLDGALLRANAFIRDFRGGKVGYVADAMKQALLLPEDMVDLRSLRRHEVFFSLKRDLVMVSVSINPFKKKKKKKNAMTFLFFLPFVASFSFLFFFFYLCFFPRQTV